MSTSMMRAGCSRFGSSRGLHERRLARNAEKKYFHDMSAVEVIEEFKKLPADEQAKVTAFVQQQAAAHPNARYADDATFQEAKTWAFKEHDELLRKLSQ